MTQLVASAISDTSVYMQWDPPARANGVLTNYTVVVFNVLTGYNFSTQVSEEEVTITGLSK